MSIKAVSRTIIVGLVGGFAATIVMDLACAGFFALAGMPLDLTYSFIGDIAESFFLSIGLNLPGGRLQGAVVHFLLGLGLGSLFGLAVSQIKVFRVGSLKKGAFLGILYAEVASQPILATAPLLGDMTPSGIFQWYALSTVMHLIYGIVLGVILSYGQKGTASAAHVF